MGHQRVDLDAPRGAGMGFCWALLFEPVQICDHGRAYSCRKAGKKELDQKGEWWKKKPD